MARIGCLSVAQYAHGLHFGEDRSHIFLDIEFCCRSHDTYIHNEANISSPNKSKIRAASELVQYQL